MSRARTRPEPRRSPGYRSAVLLAAAFLAAAVLGASAAGSESSVAGLERQFHEAGRAYDEGRIGDAVRLYEQLLDGGHPSVEVFFNLGNAFFRAGRIGRAILSYRSAWRLAPRDPDVRANLRFALQRAGVPGPEPSGLEALLTSAADWEWTIVATAGWWAGCLFLGLALLLPGRRGILLRLAAAAGALVIAGSAGLWIWSGFDRRPELVVLEAGQEALYAPLATSTPHFALPEGSIVRGRERQGAWIKVTLNGRTGWIRSAACAPVLPADQRAPAPAPLSPQARGRP